MQKVVFLLTINLVNRSLYRNKFHQYKWSSEYVQVYTDSNIADIWNVLIPFFNMAKISLQENLLDTELIYVYAKTSKLTDLEKFMNVHNVVNIHVIGDKGFNEELYSPFKNLFYEYQQSYKVSTSSH